jgi:hypothetical protein
LQSDFIYKEKPFYRYFNTTDGYQDHFYTTDLDELGLTGKDGYESEGIACYILPYKN